MLLSGNYFSFYHCLNRQHLLHKTFDRWALKFAVLISSEPLHFNALSFLNQELLFLYLIRLLKPFSKSILQCKFDWEREKKRQFRNEIVSNCNPDRLCGKKTNLHRKWKNKKSENIMRPQIQFSIAWCSLKCNFFYFVAYLVFSAQRLRNFCQTF